MKICCLLLGLIFLTACEEYWGYFVVNNSNHPIVVVYDFHKSNNGKYYPSTDWPKTLDRFCITEVDANSTRSTDLWFDYIRISPGDSLSIFIFHPDTLQKYSWEEIVNSNNYLKRYNIRIGNEADGLLGEEIVYP